MPHALRRSAVRNLERVGISRAIVMKLAGHKTEVERECVPSDYPAQSLRVAAVREELLALKARVEELVDKVEQLHQPRRNRGARP